MSLDDRMKSAFNERTTSLETTMTPTTPLETSALTAGQSNLFSAAVPWVAAAAAALAVTIGIIAFGGGDNNDTVTDNQPVTTEREDPVTSTTDTDTQSESSTEETPDSDLEPTPNLPFDKGDEPTVVTCTKPGYTVTVPTGWFHDECEPFSPAAILPPGPYEFRPEINLSYDNNETYAQAIIRINSTLTVLSSSPATVDGRTATVFVLEEEWFDVGQRTLYVVDGGGSGVFFASGNELVDSGAVVTDRAAHYKQTLVTLDAMMASVEVTYSAPVQKTQPVCIAPSFNNPVTGPSIQADVDGDGQVDTIDMVRHTAGASLVVDAGINGFYLGDFTDAGSAHVSNEIIAVDLDASGTMEILASAQSGAAGNNYESFLLSGCDLSPIGGASPAVVQRASVTNVNSFECSFGAHGNVQLDTDESIYNNGSGDYTHTGETFQFNGTNWVSLGSNNSTSANPVQLAGPSSCG